MNHSNISIVQPWDAVSRVFWQSELFSDLWRRGGLMYFQGPSQLVGDFFQGPSQLVGVFFKDRANLLVFFFKDRANLLVFFFKDRANLLVFFFKDRANLLVDSLAGEVEKQQPVDSGWETNRMDRHESASDRVHAMFEERVMTSRGRLAGW